MIIELGETVNEIVQELSLLDPIEQQQLLVKIRLTNFLKKNKAPLASYNKRKLKPPTMEQIDQWKHESRKAK